MADTLMDVLAAVYTDVDAAQKDFDGLVELVKGKKVKVEGVILVTKDDEGNITIANTGDHLGRKGAGWGGGVGVVVGLFAPALLPAVAVGAAAGAIAGKFVGHKLRDGIHDKLGENLPPGSAAVIAMFSDEYRFAIEQALPNSPAKSIAQADEGGISKLKSSLAEAMGKFSQDRTVLPIPDRTFGGSIGRTMDTSVGDWSMIPGPKAPDGAPNVLIVLVDDAGFGGPETFGGEIRTPNAHPRPADGPHLQPLPRDGRVLADARRAPHRAQSPPCGHGRDRGVPRPVPGLHGNAGRGAAPPCRESSRRTATSRAASASGT